MTALGTYKLDTGTFPTTEQGLQALRVKPEDVTQWNGPYMPQDIPKDPWGHDYVYKYPGRARRRAGHSLLWARTASRAAKDSMPTLSVGEQHSRTVGRANAGVTLHPEHRWCVMS